jgi:hypothetical protein
MATITPDEGLDWFVEQSLDQNGTDSEKIYDVAVGTGTASLSPTDTQLDVEEHRSNSSDSIVSIVNTSAPGEIEVKITISGGTEVPAGTSITEVGVFARDPTIADGNVTDADDVLVYREKRPGITLVSGDRKTFALTIEMID